LSPGGMLGAQEEWGMGRGQRVYDARKPHGVARLKPTIRLGPNPPIQSVERSVESPCGEKPRTGESIAGRPSSELFLLVAVHRMGQLESGDFDFRSSDRHGASAPPTVSPMGGLRPARPDAESARIAWRAPPRLNYAGGA
jgi:hypothetical protein